MNNIYMYNTCFYLALRPPFFAQQYSCSEKTTLFSEQVLQAAELPHWEASFAASGGLSRGIWREKAVDAGPKTGCLEAE